MEERSDVYKKSDERFDAPASFVFKSKIQDTRKVLQGILNSLPNPLEASGDKVKLELQDLLRYVKVGGNIEDSYTNIIDLFYLEFKYSGIIQNTGELQSNPESGIPTIVIHSLKKEIDSAILELMLELLNSSQFSTKDAKSNGFNVEFAEKLFVLLSSKDIEQEQVIYFSSVRRI
jgi:hypothetical protein